MKRGGYDGKAWVCKERGEQYGVDTMSRPDQWSELYWKKEPYTNRAFSWMARGGYAKREGSSMKWLQ